MAEQVAGHPLERSPTAHRVVPTAAMDMDVDEARGDVRAARVARPDPVDSTDEIRPSSIVIVPGVTSSSRTSRPATVVIVGRRRPA